MVGIWEAALKGHCKPRLKIVYIPGTDVRRIAADSGWFVYIRLLGGVGRLSTCARLGLQTGRLALDETSYSLFHKTGPRGHFRRARRG